MNNIDFSIDKYFEKLDNSIKIILLRKEKEILTYDILDTEKSKKNKLIFLKQKQYQMKIGEIWQEVLGSYKDYLNLKTGHSSGLDILSHTKKVAIELKNRTNTDNSSSKKSNLDKLAIFKKCNPEYICIYANINCDTEQQTMKGSIKKILHNKSELEIHIGYEFLKYILKEDYISIIELVKKTIDKYT